MDLPDEFYGYSTSQSFEQKTRVIKVLHEYIKVLHESIPELENNFSAFKNHLGAFKNSEFDPSVPS